MIDTYTLTTAEEEEWRRGLPADFRAGACVEYVRIEESQRGTPARLFVVDFDGRPVVAYPYFLRPVDTLPFAAGVDSGLYDTCTPDYVGPVWLDRELAPENAPFSFPELFDDHCRDQGIIAEFAHLDPWISSALIEPACVSPNREIAWVDLTWSEEEIWLKSLSSDARRQTKQGHRAGVKSRRAATPDDVKEFHRLYHLTMDRHQAADRYRFPLEYFMAFLENMSGNSFFVLAEYQGRVVAGGLFLNDDDTIRWHLSAADRAWSRVRPVNVYLYDTIRDSLGKGWRRMVLGGAYQDGDGVFRFKSNFTRLRADFNTYERLHDVAAHDRLMQSWRRHFGVSSSPERYFPAYRAQPAAPDDQTARQPDTT